MASAVEGDLSAALAMRFRGGSAASAGPASSGSALCASEDSAASVPSSAFFSLSLASRPSTRFSRASRTSVLGPRFFGTASALRQC